MSQNATQENKCASSSLETIYSLRFFLLQRKCLLICVCVFYCECVTRFCSVSVCVCGFSFYEWQEGIDREDYISLNSEIDLFSLRSPSAGLTLPLIMSDIMNQALRRSYKHATVNFSSTLQVWEKFITAGRSIHGNLSVWAFWKESREIWLKLEETWWRQDISALYSELLLVLKMQNVRFMRVHTLQLTHSRSFFTV